MNNSSLSRKTTSIALSAALLMSGSPSRLRAAETPPDLLPEVVVVGDAENLSRLPRSGHVLDKNTLDTTHPFTVNEALRKLPGLNVREEEGIGLRPNIGLRGLNPTRSTKVTLLQDGIPAAYAPYGDNASYYHPPVERFDRIEVLKGAGQIAFGPQTVGGVINYISPAPPEDFGGSLSLAGGGRQYFDGKIRLGGRGLLIDYTRKQSDGARDNMETRLNDVNFKAAVPLGAGQGLTLSANMYTEDSIMTYSGLTEAELQNFGPRHNPFKNDDFEGRRYGVSAIHELVAGAARLVTSFYYSYFSRDWWRQSSTTTDTQGGTGVRDARLAGQAIDADAINSIQGRLRDYTTLGVEPHLSLSHGFLGLQNTLETGVKAHYEIQDRKQVNGTSPTARTGTLAEDNERKTDAYSGFLMNRFAFGKWSLTPGIRYEHIHSERTNRLTGVRGSDSLGEWVPGVGATWNATDAVTAFAGVHKGFAPPRTEDIISGAGTATDVEPEESTNMELGLRFTPSQNTDLDVTLFRNDFKRLIAVGSIAGGSTPLAQGEALFQGAEAAARIRLLAGLYGRGAYTWLQKAEQTEVFRQVVGGAAVAGSKEGNRQPYAPEHALSAALGYARAGWDANIEAVWVSEQYANFSNTRAVTADGQSGTIPSHAVWNAAANYKIAQWNTSLFLTCKNLFDKEYIVDRTRGIQVGNPRLVQGGVTYAFGGN